MISPDHVHTTIYNVHGLFVRLVRFQSSLNEKQLLDLLKNPANSHRFVCCINDLWRFWMVG
jgi:hypothetical protein